MTLKKLAVATSLLTTASLSIAMGANNMDIIKKDNNPLGNKPYTEIAISTNGSCDYQILINDVPIYAGMGPINTTLPVNPYVINGSNNLAVTVQDKDESCKVSATLQIRKSDDFDSTAKLNTVVYKGNPDDITEKNADNSTKAEKLAFKDDKFEKSDDGYITVSNAKLDSGNVFYGYNYDNQKRELMAGVKVSQDINLPIDLPQWTWEKGEPIADNQETKDELIAIYKNIWKLIQDKDWDKLNKLFELRDKEMAKAFYTHPNTVASIKEKIDDDAFVNIPPNDEKLNNASNLNVYGRDKLVDLSFADGSSLLQINNNEGGATEYSISFSKLNGKFVIVG